MGNAQCSRRHHVRRRIEINIEPGAERGPEPANQAQEGLAAGIAAAREDDAGDDWDLVGEEFPPVVVQVAQRRGYRAQRDFAFVNLRALVLPTLRVPSLSIQVWAYTTTTAVRQFLFLSSV